MIARSSPSVAYAVAILGVIVASILRYWCDPILGDNVSFGFFFLAVSVAAWLGGIWPALVAAALGCLIGNYLFTHPYGSFRVTTYVELFGTIVFLAASVVIGVLSEKSLRALERARIAERQKDDFLAMLAHELRNPLAAIHYANQLDRLTGEKSDPVSAEVIDRQVRHLTRLVDDLLDISRVSRGKINLHFESLDAADVVHGALEKVRPLFEARRHVIHVHVPTEPLSLLGDRLRLEQILVNLLANAAKYTRDGGEIEISAACDEAVVEFTVRDSGVGIPRDMLDLVFEPFMQVRESTERSDGGLGIGLSLVKKLVEMHEGSVTAASKGPNCGSVFVVRLPLHRVGADSDAPAVAIAL